MAEAQGEGYGGRLAGLGSRTPIRFGTILERAFKRIMPEMSRMEEGDNDQYIYFLFKRRIQGSRFYGFSLFQAARRKGSFTVEVGMGMRQKYPYYWASAKPDYSIDGVRERLGIISDYKDRWWKYTSLEELERHIDSVLHAYLSTGIQSLYRNHAARLEREVNEWQGRADYYRSQLEEVSNPKEFLLSLPNITDIHEYIRKQLRLGVFERFFPHFLRAEMRAPQFVILQACLMSDIIERPETANRAIEEGKLMDYQDDLISLLTGRLPQEIYQTDDEREAYLRFSYFKSMSVMETIVGMEKEREEYEKAAQAALSKGQKPPLRTDEE